MKNWILLMLFAMGLLGAPTAAAGKRVTIQTIGVPSYDKIFTKARQMETKVVKAEQRVQKSRINFNNAMGLTRKTAYKDGVKELKQRAKNKLRLTLQGNVPTLVWTDALPAKAKRGAEALNMVFKGHITTLRDLSTLPKMYKQLAVRTRKMPTNFRTDVANNRLRSLFHLRAIKTISQNVQTISELPERTKTVITRIKQQMKTITAAFGMNWLSAGK